MYADPFSLPKAVNRVPAQCVVQCLSCVRCKAPAQFLGEGARATEPPYPTPAETPNGPKLAPYLRRRAQPPASGRIQNLPPTAGFHSAADHALQAAQVRDQVQLS